jgi:hypothetical protein
MAAAGQGGRHRLVAVKPSMTVGERGAVRDAATASFSRQRKSVSAGDDPRAERHCVR